MLDRLQKAQFDFKEDGNKDYEFLINKYKENNKGDENGCCCKSKKS